MPYNKRPITARILALASWPLFPLLATQGWYVRARTPRLPAACGLRLGQTGGEGEVLRLLVLGESTTAGVGAQHQQQALAARVAAALAGTLRRPVAWEARGEIGYKLRRVRRLLLRDVNGPRDAVIIAMGVNDTIGFSPVTHWRRELLRTIRACAALPGEPVIFLSGVPPLGRFPLFPRPLRDILGARAQLLDETAAGIAAAHPQVTHVPVDFNGGEELLCEDGFHPSPEAYDRWAQQLAGPITRKLKETLRRDE